MIPNPWGGSIPVSPVTPILGVALPKFPHPWGVSAPGDWSLGWLCPSDPRSRSVPPLSPPVSPRCPPCAPGAARCQQRAERAQARHRLSPCKKASELGKASGIEPGGLKKPQEPGPGGCKPPAAAGDGGEPGAGEARPRARRFGDRGSAGAELSVVIPGLGAALVLIPAACYWFLGWSGGAGCVP